jgi:hypothetical protein
MKKNGNVTLENLLLESDSRLIIVAGRSVISTSTKHSIVANECLSSDTTASTLTFTFYHLAHDPNLVEKLRVELKLFQDKQGGFSVKDLQGAEFLTGIINETLRLLPAVPSGVLRITPKEGININGTFIPGEITIASPTWSIGHRKFPFCLQVLRLVKLTFSI